MKQVFFDYFKALLKTWFFYLATLLFLYDFIATFLLKHGLKLPAIDVDKFIIIAFLIANFEIYRKLDAENKNLQKKLNELKNLKPNLSLSFKEWLLPLDSGKTPRLMKGLTIPVGRSCLAQVILNNEGGIPAENVHVHLLFPKGFKLELIKDPLSRFPIRPSSISINNQEVVLSQGKLKHGYSCDLEHFWIEPVETGEFDIEYKITADNISNEQTGKLQIHV